MTLKGFKLPKIKTFTDTKNQPLNQNGCLHKNREEKCSKLITITNY